MPSKTIVIDEVPRGKPSVRVTRWVTYDPSKEFRTYIKWIIRDEWKDTEIIKGPVEVFFKFYMPIPKSTSKKNRALMISGDIKHIKKPDRDNMEKLFNDCMSGIVFEDDKQSWNGNSTKLYDEKPRAEIKIVW